MKAPALLEKVLTEYDARRERENWRGVVFCRIKFDHTGAHLEHWSVELPRNEQGVGARKAGAK